MTAPATPQSPERRRRRTVQFFVAVLVLVLLLAPVVYLFGPLWSSTGSAMEIAQTQRAAVAYARPLHKLLAALVDAQSAAARETAVDAPGVRAVVDEVDAVDAVDRQLTDPLQARQRWNQLRHEIDSTLTQNPSGSEALRGYAAPIALTQALLARIADASKVTGDPGTGVIYGALAQHEEHRSYAGTAAEHSLQAVRLRQAGENRSFTFDLIALATAHALDGQFDGAEKYAHRALNHAEAMRSARVRDRLQTRWDVAAPHAAQHSGLADLGTRIRALQAA